jgi:O-antigen/teichoic acid export membrane protein
MASLFQDARAVFLTNVICALAGLGSQSCLAWFLLAEGRGQYAACLLFATVVTLCCTLGQEMANAYYVGAKKISASESFTQSLLLGVVAVVLGCGGGYALTLTGLSFLEKAPMAWFRWSLICVPPLIVHLYLSRILLGLSDMKSFTFVTALPAVAEAVGLAFSASMLLSVPSAIAIHAGADALGAVAAGVILYHRHGCRLVPITKSSLWRSLNYGGRFYVGKLLSFSNVHIATFVLLMSRVNPSDIGLFAAATAMASRLWMVSDAFHVALLPRASGDPEGQGRVIAQTTRLCLAVSAVIALGVFLFSEPLIQFILSPRFLPVLSAFQWLLLGAWIRVIPKILTAYFSGTERPGINSVAMCLSVGVNISLMLLLLPIWGLVGAAFATMIAYFIEGLFLAGLFWRVSGLSPGRLLRPATEDWAAARRLWHRWVPGARVQGGDL